MSHHRSSQANLSLSLTNTTPTSQFLPRPKSYLLHLYTYIRLKRNQRKRKSTLSLREYSGDKEQVMIYGIGNHGLAHKMFVGHFSKRTTATVSNGPTKHCVVESFCPPIVCPTIYLRDQTSKQDYPKVNFRGNISHARPKINSFLNSSSKLQMSSELI
jgi:hypothetical protein